MERESRADSPAPGSGPSKEKGREKDRKAARVGLDHEVNRREQGRLEHPRARRELHTEHAHSLLA